MPPLGGRQGSGGRPGCRAVSCRSSDHRAMQPSTAALHLAARPGGDHLTAAAYPRSLRPWGASDIHAAPLPRAAARPCILCDDTRSPAAPPPPPVSSAAAPQSNNKWRISAEEWQRKLKDVRVRKEDMNRVVMNFLVTEVGAAACSSGAGGFPRVCGGDGGGKGSGHPRCQPSPRPAPHAGLRGRGARV